MRLKKGGGQKRPMKYSKKSNENLLFFALRGDPYENEKRKRTTRESNFFAFFENIIFEDKNRPFQMGFLLKKRGKKGERDMSVTSHHYSGIRK